MALEKVYVSINFTDMRSSKREISEDNQFDSERSATISEILNLYRRIVVIGDPGCGKTALLAYLTLTYARDRREGVGGVKTRLQLDESDYLPIPLTLRNLGQYLSEKYADSSKDGPELMLDYLREYYQSQNITLPVDFFIPSFENGKAILLLDGLDEVADPTLRQRIARIIERFSDRYPQCRLIITSRVLSYSGAARLGAEFGVVRVRQFGKEEARQFILDWTRVVETTLASSDAPEILRMADQQANRLINSIENNSRVVELTTNPLLLTIVALVYRYRAELPNRRSELYEEAVEVLLGHWDEAKGLETNTLIAGRELDAGDRRSLLEPVAFWMHERQIQEIDRDDLNSVLLSSFESFAGDSIKAHKDLDDFLRSITERSGLLVENYVGVYRFVSSVFQEYLAARALANRQDALDFTLMHICDTWWREVILLQAGYLSTQGKRRVSELIRAIMNADPTNEPEPKYYLLLASDCLADVGAARVESDLVKEIQNRMNNIPIKDHGE